MVKEYSKLKDPKVRAILLGSLESGKAEAKLVMKALKDKNPLVQNAALRAAASLGLEEARKKAIKALKDANLEVRVGAAIACATYGGKDAFSALAKISLKPCAPDLRAALGRGLSLARELEEVEVLSESMLKARNREVQAFLANALIKAGVYQPAIAGVAFGQLLKEGGDEMRVLALRGIEATVHEASLPMVIELLDHREPMIRSDAVRALRAFPAIPEVHAQQIIEMSRDPNPMIRVSATMSLKNLPPEIAIPALAERLHDEVWSVQDVAVESLGGMRNVSATRLLAEHMKSAKGLVRELTYEYLRAHTGQDFGPTSDSWSRWFADQPDDYELPGIEEAEEMLRDLEAKRSVHSSGYAAVEYHGIPVRSGGIVFILDRSKSMGEKYSSDAQLLHDYFAKELSATVEGLRGDHSFNLIFFSDDAMAWRSSLVQANGKSKEAALDYIAKLRPSGATYPLDAFEIAFLDDDVEQIYFMTDGDPSGGEVMKATIIDRVMELNRTRRVRIHTIVAGDVHGDFLNELATLNSGICVDLR